MNPQQLLRVRWAVRAVLALAIAASVTANVLHAHPNPISQSIAAWPPLAFLVTVELISRVPIARRWLSAARLVAMAAIAGIAAWVSYWHQVAICARYGETGAAPFLLPLTIDGMVVIASVSLVELAARIRAVDVRADDAGGGDETAVGAAPPGSGRSAPIPDKRIRASIAAEECAPTLDAVRAAFGVSEQQATRVLAGLRVNGTALSEAADA